MFTCTKRGFVTRPGPFGCEASPGRKIHVPIILSVHQRLFFLRSEHAAAAAEIYVMIGVEQSAFILAAVGVGGHELFGRQERLFA